MKNTGRFRAVSDHLRAAILVLGALGNNGMTRIRFALRQLIADGLIDNVVLVDIRKIREALPYVSGMLPGGLTYVRIPPSYQLPMEELRNLGLDGKRLYTLITTPTAFHVPYARQAARYSQKVIVEKPLSCSEEEIRQLIGCPNCWPADHYLHKTPVRIAGWILERSADKKELLDGAVLEFDLLEKAAIGNRAIDDAIRDLFCHFCGLSIFLSQSIDSKPCFTITHVSTATYREGDGRSPSTFTAARVEGYLHVGGNAIRFYARVGKGTDRDLKQLIIRYQDGTIAPIPLDQTGWEAHYQMLRMFLTEETPLHSLNLGDALTIAGACNEACAKASRDDEPEYELGALPAILQGGMISNPGEYRIAQWAQHLNLTPTSPVLVPA